MVCVVLKNSLNTLGLPISLPLKKCVRRINLSASFTGVMPKLSPHDVRLWFNVLSNFVNYMSKLMY